MDTETVAVYEDRGLQWSNGKKAVRTEAAANFQKAVAPGAIRADVGCGAGRYTGLVGSPVVGLDAARTMLHASRDAVPGAIYVQGDLEALPFRAGGLGGTWANMSYLHLPRARLPLALWDLHRAMVVGAPLDLGMLAGDHEGNHLPEDKLGGRYFAGWRADDLVDVLVGGGFSVRHVDVEDDEVHVRATRERTLADTVGPGMRLLICGLNPSLYAADAGVGFARPGNRFWPAALDAGVVSRDRDPLHALHAHGIGMTDLVKRASARADGLGADEYRQGLDRLTRLVAWLRPAGVCMVGLAGWRAAADRSAVPGWQARDLAGRPVYVMPSTSGANARAGRDELADHLRAACSLADRASSSDLS